MFSSDNAKRVTKYNSNPPENQLEKITLADPNLSEKMNCIPVGYEDYDVTNTQYLKPSDYIIPILSFQIMNSLQSLQQDLKFTIALTTKK